MDNSFLVIAILLATLIVITLVIAIIALFRVQKTRNRMDSLLNGYGQVTRDTSRAVVDQMGLVNQRLESVYQGLGEMRNVANSVGDLKKILSNVKTRGILGEVQLAGILGQIMSKEQYAENVETIPGSNYRVEFAIKLPGDGDNPVYLPIDSKFPGDAYAVLMDAYELGDKAIISQTRKALMSGLKNMAKDIKNKYIEPPYTTDFGIMFLPFEGLYSEAINCGMVEELQRCHNITIAGPTTMAALINSLQMGFNTLVMEKKSHEVWETLGAVKTEFEKFDKGLNSVRKHFADIDNELDSLVGTRSRVINRKLRSVISMDEDRAREILDDE